MDFDDAAAAGDRRQAGTADEIFDALFREHIGQFLLGHAQRLDQKEPVEQPFDFGIGGCDVITETRQRLQLAFLAPQTSSERSADQCGRRCARWHCQ